jgi:hypothetical protein
MKTAGWSRFVVGPVFLFLTQGLAAVAPPAQADDLPLHHVKYTITAAKPIYATIYYLDTEPANFGVYSHDPYQFAPNIQADVGPGKPWTYELDLADPNDWAMVTAGTGGEPATPGFHCELAVDGAVVDAQDGPNGVLCSIRGW